MNRELGHQTVLTLRALAGGCRYGFDVVARTGSHSATVYRSLRRLEKLGFVQGVWENPDIAVEEARPRRKYYEVTPEGLAALEDVIARYREVTEFGGDIRTSES